MTPIEIERKFLIRMPDISALRGIDGIKIKNITQTYLKTADGSTARVRVIDENDSITYIKTVKNKISNISHYEDEREIDAEQYELELKNADSEKKPVVKIRYAFPFNSHIVEIDVYPFWDDKAVVELELSDENTEPVFPPQLKVICEVTDDDSYKNASLAKIKEVK